MPWLLLGLIGAAFVAAASRTQAAAVAVRAGSRVLITLSHSLMTQGDREAFEVDVRDSMAGKAKINSLHFTDDRLALDVTYSSNTSLTPNQTMTFAIPGGGSYTATIRGVDFIEMAA